MLNIGDSRYSARMTAKTVGILAIVLVSICGELCSIHDDGGFFGGFGFKFLNRQIQILVLLEARRSKQGPLISPFDASLCASDDFSCQICKARDLRHHVNTMS